MENQSSQKQQRIGRARRTLRAIRSFVDRHLTTRTVVVVTILLLVASWIYPPWIIGSGRYISHGWFFVFDTTREIVMRVDLGRLLLIDAIIAAAGGLLAWTFFQNSTGRRVAVRIVFYTVVAAPIAAVIFLGTVLIQNIQHDVAKRAAQKKRFDPSTATLVEEPKTSEAAPPPKASEYDALLTAAPPSKASPFDPDKYLAAMSVVSAADLKRITLFDVGPDFDFLAMGACTGFHGRVRNDLPRAVQNIDLKASFYNAQGELIEVRTFGMTSVDGEQRIFPNTPVSFKGDLSSPTASWTAALSRSPTEIGRAFGERAAGKGVEHLPEGWKYQLEVTEAHYVK